jgi:hypothetical protein
MNSIDVNEVLDAIDAVTDTLTKLDLSALTYDELLEFAVRHDAIVRRSDALIHDLREKIKRDEAV